MKEKQFISVIPYSGGGDLLADARTIIDGARQYAYSAVNTALVQRNWLLGKRSPSLEALAQQYASQMMDSVTLFFTGDAYQNRGVEGRAIAGVFNAPKNKPVAVAGKNMVYAVEVKDVNVEAYDLDTLRKLVRDLQAENKSLKELLAENHISFEPDNVFDTSNRAPDE